MGKKRYLLTKYRYHPEREDTLNRIHMAEPAPLGLFGLSMGCMLLICGDFELTKGGLMLIPWLVCLPGLLQIIAGIIDFLRHNIFGGTAFLSYGMFWTGLATVFVLETYNAELALLNADNDDIQHFAKVLLLPSDPTVRQHTGVVCWGYLFFSLLMTVISAGINRILFWILFFIDWAFFFLCLHIFAETPAFLVGIFLLGVFCASMYGFVCILLLKIAGGEVIPVGKPFIDWSKYVMHDQQIVFLDREKREKFREMEEDVRDDDEVSVEIIDAFDRSTFNVGGDGAATTSPHSTIIRRQQKSLRQQIGSGEMGDLNKNNRSISHITDSSMSHIIYDGDDKKRPRTSKSAKTKYKTGYVQMNSKK